MDEGRPFLERTIAFFVEFERQIALEAPPGIMDSEPRNVRALLDLFKAYSGCTFELLEADFSHGMPRRRGGQAKSASPRPHQIASLIFNFGHRAEIVINTMKDNYGEYVVNFCHRRFYIIKEAFHVILRDEFLRNGTGHPDTADPEELKSSVEKMIFLPFSILDLNNPDYPESERIENTAELLALLTLYPMDKIFRDRQEFLLLLGAATFENSTIMVANTFPYADTHKVPERYVDLAFRWSHFDELYELYSRYRR